MSIKDRFPFNKRRRDPEPIKCVYAGPEQMARRAGWDQGINEVYAGPEGPDPAEPEEIDLPLPQELESAPSKPMEGVYAGPNPPVMQPVYAAPEPPSPLMMCVYAGPDYFNGTNGGGAGAPAQEQDPNVRYCPNCGWKAAQTDKYCTSCGFILPKKETT